MWFRDTKAHNSITLDGPLIQAQALKTATMLQKPDFKAIHVAPSTISQTEEAEPSLTIETETEFISKEKAIAGLNTAREYFMKSKED
ncbi:hypothetical protein BpHYR1_029239 [Brachionus plicatilis]|uniref:Uncharacterized protein n=1 Tax=Brachionus plicatilis TaxID=10195 RepID=A0A3M7RCE3_BRAPC|nr:hypothetical protein BpHYR1_029239 [Brachionus plicatilis]